MEIRPILSTLMRHKTAATLIVLEIALTCAIICNALFMIGERITQVNEASGLAENELVRVQLIPIGNDENARLSDSLFHHHSRLFYDNNDYIQSQLIKCEQAQVIKSPYKL